MHVYRFVGSLAMCDLCSKSPSATHHPDSKVAKSLGFGVSGARFKVRALGH